MERGSMERGNTEKARLHADACGSIERGNMQTCAESCNAAIEREMTLKLYARQPERGNVSVATWIRVEVQVKST